MAQNDQLLTQFTGYIAREPGGSDVLCAVQRPMPIPGPAEVLIKIAAAGINRPDIVQREGRYPPPPGASDILGLEVSGTIVALGPDVDDLALGQNICALIAGGGYADYALCPIETCLPVPAGLTLEQAAALPETGFTVWANVFEAGGLQAGETLLVHGATSGIGTMAIQMAKAAGAKVIATARSDQKCAQALEVGADIAINSSAGPFAEQVRELGGADVVLDMVGGPMVQQGLDCMNVGGRMVFIAFLAGAKVELDLGLVLFRHLHICGSTLRSRPLPEKMRLKQEMLSRVWPWIEAGKVTPVIDREFALADVAEAHDYLEAGAHFGKILLKP
ncbi:MAG: NAD(P)H-quinone oxidoreductase [Robiginitomaculum sp.]|nr:MAG: NAD(P)H-quinone oxidoreductase [Robiginitomaculum sp.]